ncbi:hypothetical protein J421_1947 [Gemmatirosa kalamazoonensis]|uniref:Uncharacterized protein n=1 Tax=Gemmatirosa kalamazoonensis TaxID=861299 RepID=W0REE5_9BACT|nr:hypothetical protein [Gemmatirosa kalamazoonensis]AHG89484.1 hypothetical protein J421_1947 [Gemmatirosa kalamazoonensis]
MSDSRLDAPNGRASATLAADRTLEHRHLAAIRAARLVLLDSARRADASEIEAAIAPFVRSMRDADFSRPTICSLVAAAIDAGLPTGRGPARRAQRAASLARWTRLAGELADGAARDA